MVPDLCSPPNLAHPLEHTELPAKLLDHFLRSNNSNINQSPERPGLDNITIQPGLTQLAPVPLLFVRCLVF